MLRVETSLVMSHKDAPQEPELESCYIEDIIWRWWGEGGYESSSTDFITYLIIFLNYNKITIEKLLKALKTFETVMEYLKKNK